MLYLSELIAKEPKLIEEVATELHGLQHYIDYSGLEDNGEDDRFIEVRANIQFSWDGNERDYSLTVLHGSTQNDTDHRGFWGYGTVHEDSTEDDINEIASEIVTEMIDAFAMTRIQAQAQFKRMPGGIIIASVISDEDAKKLTISGSLKYPCMQDLNGSLFSSSQPIETFNDWESVSIQDAQPLLKLLVTEGYDILINPIQ